MKAGFSILCLVTAIGTFIYISHTTNSPILIQPMATKNYFLYRVYIHIHALCTRISRFITTEIQTPERHPEFISGSLVVRNKIFCHEMLK